MPHNLFGTRTRIGSWRSPTGNLVQVSVACEPDGTAHLFSEWAALPLTAIDWNFYSSVVVPQALGRLADSQQPDPLTA